MKQTLCTVLVRTSAALLLWALIACSRTPGELGSTAPTPRSDAIVVTAPYAPALVRTLAGDAVRVTRLAPPTSGLWTLSDDDIDRVQGAGLVVVHGAGYEPWLHTTALPYTRVVRTADDLPGGYAEMPMPTHSHGIAGASTALVPNPATWTDPRNLGEHTRVIAARLEAAYPARAAEIRASAEDLKYALERLAERLDAIGSSLDGVMVVLADARLAYLARGYDFVTITADLDAGGSPDTEEVAIVRSLATIDDTRGVVVVWAGESPAWAARELPTAAGFTHAVWSVEPVADGGLPAWAEGNVRGLETAIGRAGDP